jgi:hypothetical protein
MEALLSTVLARMNERQKQEMVIATLNLVEALEDEAYTRKPEDKKRVAENLTHLCAMVRKLRKEFDLDVPKS